MSHMPDNLLRLKRGAEDSAAAKMLRLLLQPGLPLPDRRRSLLRRWRNADGGGRLLRFEIDQRLQHMSRVQLAAIAGVVDASAAASTLKQERRLLSENEVQDYLRVSKRFDSWSRLIESVEQLTESPADVRADARWFPSELCLAVISFDMVLRSAPVRALTARVEEIAIADSATQERRLSDLGDLIARQYLDSIVQHPTQIVGRDRQAEQVLAAFDMFALLDELERLLEMSDKANQRERFIDHYSYWTVFIGHPLYHVLGHAANVLLQDKNHISGLMEISPEEVAATSARIERLAERTLMPTRSRTSPQEPPPRAAST